MIFASIELVTRIEASQCHLLRACTTCAAQRHPELDVFMRPIAGGLATHVGPDSPLNKIAGLGFAGPVDEHELEAIERAFADRDTPVQIELSCLADPPLAGMLTRRGYTITGFESVLGRALAPGSPPSPTAGAIEVTPTRGDDEDAAWLDAVVTGFGELDAQGVASHESFARESLERVIGDMAATEGFARYLARREGEIAGGGGVRIGEGIAQLCGASTLPAHRRRGVQAALLDARLAAAAQAACELAVATTLPGSRSQHNVQRRGFELLYTRTILVRDPNPPATTPAGS